MKEKERSFRKRVEKRRKEKAEKAKKEKNKYTIILRIIIGVLITFIVFSVIALIEAIVLICSDSLKHPYIRSTLCYKTASIAGMLLALGITLFCVFPKDLSLNWKTPLVCSLCIVLATLYSISSYEVFDFEIKNDKYITYTGNFEYDRGPHRQLASYIHLTDEKNKTIKVYGFRLTEGRKYTGTIIYSEYSKCVVNFKISSVTE